MMHILRYYIFLAQAMTCGTIQNIYIQRDLIRQLFGFDSFVHSQFVICFLCEAVLFWLRQSRHSGSAALCFGKTWRSGETICDILENMTKSLGECQPLVLLSPMCWDFYSTFLPFFFPFVSNSHCLQPTSDGLQPNSDGLLFLESSS